MQELSARLTGPGVEECWMEIEGARMRYLRTGSGPPFILLHGLFGYSFSWRYTMPALAPYATVYAPDLLGAGFSGRPRGIDHSMEGTAKRVVQFADNLELGSFDLLGTSRGGAVAMAAAAQCMDSGGKGAPLVRRLILVCPVNPYSPHGKLLAPFLGTRFGAAGFRHIVAHMPFLFAYWHGRLFGDRSKIPPESLDGYMAPLAIPGLFEHGLSIASTWTADLKQLAALLPTISSIPALLIWGNKDPAVDVSSMEPLSRHFENAQRIVFPGIGHLPYEECPAKFNQALIKFLTSSIGPVSAK